MQGNKQNDQLHKGNYLLTNSLKGTNKHNNRFDPSRWYERRHKLIQTDGSNRKKRNNHYYITKIVVLQKMMILFLCLLIICIDDITMAVATVTTTTPTTFSYTTAATTRTEQPKERFDNTKYSNIRGSSRRDFYTQDYVNDEEHKNFEVLEFNDRRSTSTLTEHNNEMSNTLTQTTNNNNNVFFQESINELNHNETNNNDNSNVIHHGDEEKKTSHQQRDIGKQELQQNYKENILLFPDAKKKEFDDIQPTHKSQQEQQRQEERQRRRQRQRRFLSFLSFSPNSSPDDNIAVTTDVSFEEILFTMIFLMLVAIVGKCMEFISIPSLVGEMLVGMLLGPRLINFVPFPEALVIIGYLGLITMMLEFGIEVDIAQLKLNGIRCAVAAVVGALVALGIAWGMGSAFGLSIEAGFALGASFAPTSTGIAASVLGDGGLLNTPVGQFVVTAGIFDDTVGLILLAELQAVASPYNDVWQYVAPIISAVAWVIVLGYSAMTWLPRFIMNHILVHFPKPHRASVGYCCLLLLSLIYMCAMNYTRASYLTGAFLAGLTFSEVSIVHKTFIKRTRNLFDWMTRIFFAASIAFQVPVRLFANPNVIGGGFILFIPVLSKLFMGLFLPRRHPSSSSSKKKKKKEQLSSSGGGSEKAITSNNNSPAPHTTDAEQNGEDAIDNPVFHSDSAQSNNVGDNENDIDIDDRPDGYPFDPNIRDALITGLALTCRGEMNFIVGAFGVQAKMFTPELYASMVWAVLLSTVICPIALQTCVGYYHRLESKYVDETLPQWHYNDGRVPLYLSIQSRSMVSMNLYSTYKQTIQNLGLKVIDYRTWHPRGFAAMTTCVMELYVQDTKVSLIKRHDMIDATLQDEEENSEEQQQQDSFVGGISTSNCDSSNNNNNSNSNHHIDKEEQTIKQQQQQSQLLGLSSMTPSHNDKNEEDEADNENSIIEARCDEIRNAIMAILNDKAEVQVSQWKVDQVGTRTDSSSSSSSSGSSSSSSSTGEGRDRRTSVHDYDDDNDILVTSLRHPDAVETPFLGKSTNSATASTSSSIRRNKNKNKTAATQLSFKTQEVSTTNNGTEEDDQTPQISTNNNDHPLLRVEVEPTNNNDISPTTTHHHQRGHHRRQSTIHNPVLAKDDLWNDINIQAEIAAAITSRDLDEEIDYYDERTDLHQPCRYGITQQLHHRHHHRHHGTTKPSKPSHKPHRSRYNHQEEQQQQQQHNDNIDDNNNNNNNTRNNIYEEDTLLNLSMPTTAERLTGIVRYNKIDDGFGSGGGKGGPIGALLRRRHNRGSVIVADLTPGLRKRTKNNNRRQSITVAELPMRRKQSQQQQQQQQHQH